MKKFLSFMLTACLLIAVMTGFVSAENEDKWLPFDVTPPENVAIEWLEGGDSPQTCSIGWSKNASLSEWMTKMGDPETHDATVEEFQAKGYDDIIVTTQMDWSIDSKEDWHYNVFWDTEGYDQDYRMRLGEWAYTSFLESADTVVTAWVFRGFGNIDDETNVTWFGDHVNADYDGWKDVLKEDQYEVIETEDGHTAKIDLSEHTIYVRMRYLVKISTTQDDMPIEYLRASEWSEIAAVGKDAEKRKVLTKDDIKAPNISDLRIADEEHNNYPVIAFKIEVPEELAKADTELQADHLNGGRIIIKVEARAQGTDEWTEIEGDWIMKSGDQKYYLQRLAEAAKEKGQTIGKDTPLEVRAKYICSQGDLPDIESDYSNIITFGSPDMEVVTEPTPTEAPAKPDPTLTPTPAPKEKEKKDKCGLCGFCPRPLGICIFIWLLIIIIIVVAVIVVIKMTKKDKKPEEAPAAGPEDKKE